MATAFAAKEREFEIGIPHRSSKRRRLALDSRATARHSTTQPECQFASSASASTLPNASAPLPSCAPSLKRWKRRSESAPANWRRRTRPACRAEESLRQAQKMEAVGQLTGGIAHDFNNLLTVVMGGLDVIGRQIPTLPPSAGDVAHRAGTGHGVAGRAAGGHPDQPVAGVLAAADVEPARRRRQQAGRRTCPTSCTARSAKSVSLETVLAGGLWRTFADPNQLENAILNLALNARDAMPDGGKLTIETANCLPRPGLCRAGSRSPSSRANTS